MNNKMREEFEAWASDKDYIVVARDRVIAFKAWQHQQAVIDAKDAKLRAVFAELDTEPFGQLELQQEHHLQANALFKIRKILEGRS